MKHWEFKQSLALSLLVNTNGNRLQRAIIPVRGALNSDIPTEICVEESDSIDFTTILNDHLLLKVNKKRKQCDWIKENGLRCGNKTYSACHACRLDNEYYLLCGKCHIKHQRHEANTTLQLRRN